MQEGEKSYEYGWLDKVTRILENGKEVARFEYHNNNQLAKVVRENGIETFEWDGLALIEKNDTKYINEPHAGGRQSDIGNRWRWAKNRGYIYRYTWN